MFNATIDIIAITFIMHSHNDCNIINMANITKMVMIRSELNESWSSNHPSQDPGGGT